jgi:hypothetical protein
MARDHLALQLLDESEGDVEIEEPWTSTLEPPRQWRSGKGVNLVAVLPVALAIVMLWVPGYAERIRTPPPDMLGIPFGMVLLASAILWSLLGAAVISQTRYRVLAALALATTTIPSLILIPFIATLIVYMQNLSV